MARSTSIPVATSGTATVPVPRRSLALSLLLSLRPAQWSKNLIVFAGLLFAHPSLIDVPFYVAGALKIAYDLLLFRAFRSVKPPEEVTR